MIDFALKKKWIKDAMYPVYMEDYRLTEKDLTGDWEYLTDNFACKVIETMILNLRRRLLVTVYLNDLPDGTSEMIMVKAEEIHEQ